MLEVSLPSPSAELVAGTHSYLSYLDREVRMELIGYVGSLSAERRYPASEVFSQVSPAVARLKNRQRKVFLRFLESLEPEQHLALLGCIVQVDMNERVELIKLISEQYLDLQCEQSGYLMPEDQILEPSNMICYLNHIFGPSPQSTRCLA